MEDIESNYCNIPREENDTLTNNISNKMGINKP